MKNEIKLILFVFFAGGCLMANGQSECSQALIEAERAYYTGRFDEIRTLLAGCIASNDKNQKTEAYRLIALGKIFTKDFEQADSALLHMLKSNPQYEFAAQDPPEFRKRVENFKVHPFLEAAISLGLVQPFFKVTEVYDSRLLPATGTYKGKVGYHAGISVAYYLTKKISIKGGYEMQSYSFTVEDANELNTTLLTETQRRTQLLAAAGYGFFWPKINLQFYGGLIYSTLKKADVYLVMDRETSGAEIEFNYSNLDQRTRHEWRPVAELKLNLPFKNGWTVSVNTRYELGLTNITNEANRYNSLNHATQFEWVEDDFKGRYFLIGVGVSKLFYLVKQR